MQRAYNVEVYYFFPIMPSEIPLLACYALSGPRIYALVHDGQKYLLETEPVCCLDAEVRETLPSGKRLEYMA